MLKDRLMTGATLAKSGCAAATVLAVMFTTSCASRDQVDAGRGPSGSGSAVTAGTLSPSALLQSITGLAARNGSTTISDVQYVTTTEGPAAQTVFGDPSTSQTADTATPVYVIAARGTFVGTGAKVPAGATVPTGSVLTEIVRVDDGAITDWGINDSYPALDQLGTAVQLAK